MKKRLTALVLFLLFFVCMASIQFASPDTPDNSNKTPSVGGVIARALALSAEKSRTRFCKFLANIYPIMRLENQRRSSPSSNQCPIIVQSRSNQPHPEVRPLRCGNMSKRAVFAFWASVQRNPADYTILMNLTKRAPFSSEQPLPYIPRVGMCRRAASNSHPEGIPKDSRRHRV